MLILQLQGAFLGNTRLMNIAHEAVNIDKVRRLKPGPEKFKKMQWNYIKNWLHIIFKLANYIRDIIIIFIHYSTIHYTPWNFEIKPPIFFFLSHSEKTLFMWAILRKKTIADLKSRIFRMKNERFWLLINLWTLDWRNSRSFFRFFGFLPLQLNIDINMNIN